MQSLSRQSHAAPPRRDLARRDLARRDPAPTRWQYRMQRLWLTPSYRALVRIGGPLAAVALVVALVVASPARREAIWAGYVSIKEQFQARPEFRVGFLSIEGASPDLADAVRAKLDVKLPQSSFDLNLDALRVTAENFDAVASAEVRVRSGGVLQVLLTERVPALVWRGENGLELIDATGHRVAGLSSREDRPDLPLVAGEGADQASAEALALLTAAAPVMPRLRGLVRMGDRRWDVVLDRDQRILLPAKDPVPALERFLAMDQAEKILDRDLLTIDLRDGKRPVLRLAPFALSEAHRDTNAPAATENSL